MPGGHGSWLGSGPGSGEALWGSRLLRGPALGCCCDPRGTVAVPAPLWSLSGPCRALCMASLSCRMWPLSLALAAPTQAGRWGQVPALVTAVPLRLLRPSNSPKLECPDPGHSLSESHASPEACIHGDQALLWGLDLAACTGRPAGRTGSWPGGGCGEWTGRSPHLTLP